MSDYKRSKEWIEAVKAFEAAVTGFQCIAFHNF